MAAMANIVVFDGAATPVSHTLVPIDTYLEKDGSQVARYREAITSLPDEAQVSAILKKKTLPSGVVAKEFRVSVPVMESIAGQNAAGYTAAPKVAYVDQVVVQTFSHPRSTPQGRRIARMLAVNMANNIATSVAAATSGPAVELLDNGVVPS